MRNSKRPPGHLSKQSKMIWTQISKGWQLSPLDLEVLIQGLESLDLVNSCKQAIEKDGLLVQVKGQSRAHPLPRTLKEHRTICLRALSRFNLDLGEDNDVQRRKFVNDRQTKAF